MTMAATARWWTLDAGTDWRARVSDNLVVDSRDALTIRALTGRAEPMAPSNAIRPCRCPSGLAADGRGRLLVIDAATAQVTAAASHKEDVWPTVGGEGLAPRRFRAPRGLAVLPSGALAVADTGNHRVQVFAGTTATLVQLFGAADALGRPKPGARPLEFNQPWDVAADRRGRLYIADRGNARVQCVAADGRWRGDLGTGFLRAPVRLAAGCHRTLAVVDAGLNAVLVFTPGRPLPRTLPVQEPASVAFGAAGSLFVGDQRGTVHTFAESSPGSGRYEFVGSAPTGLPRAIIALALFGVPRRLALLVEAPTAEEIAIESNADSDDLSRTLWTLDPTGGRALQGVLLTEAIDSGREGHRWQRVRVQAEVPSGTTVEVESATSEEAQPGVELTWVRCVTTGESNPDCLVQSTPGQYLWLRLRLRSNGRVAPAIHRIDVSLGQAGYLQYLPAVFQEDDESRRFLERFLAIFQSGFDDLSALVDCLGDLFDPWRARADHLPWLAGWVGLIVDPTWSEAELRSQLAGAVQGFRRRGTADGLQASIRAYADVEARIVEHYRLRQLLRLNEAAPLDGSAPLWSPARTQRLQLGSYSQLGRFRLTSHPEPAIEALEWAAHRFTVLFDADPYSVADTAARVARVVARDKPAHTDATICPVFPRMRVGIQARLGVDASVGDISYTVLSRLATLNYDTVLGCSDHERSLAAYGAALGPRVGATTRMA